MPLRMMVVIVRVQQFLNAVDRALTAGRRPILLTLHDFIRPPSIGGCSNMSQRANGSLNFFLAAQSENRLKILHILYFISGLHLRN